jgi:hypothetical protein
MLQQSEIFCAFLTHAGGGCGDGSVGAGPCACPHTIRMRMGNHRGLPLPMTELAMMGSRLQRSLS